MIKRPYRIDASMMRDWLDCRELFRQKWVANREPTAPPIHRELGIAFHKGVDEFWRGNSYESAFKVAIGHCRDLDVSASGIKDRNRWDELRHVLPDMLEAYFRAHDENEIKSVVWSEKEWEIPYPPLQSPQSKPYGGVTLCGRIDRVMGLGWGDEHGHEARKLVDVKTASAIGDWRSSLRKQYARDIGLALYDWYVREATGHYADEVEVEIAIKPYRGSRPQIVPMDLTPEIAAGRERFHQQLRMIVTEITYWLDHYQEMSPWPMSPGTQCLHKYGECEFLKLCLEGENAVTLKGYRERREHLKVREKVEAK